MASNLELIEGPDQARRPWWCRADWWIVVLGIGVAALMIGLQRYPPLFEAVRAIVHAFICAALACVLLSVAVKRSVGWGWLLAFACLFGAILQFEKVRDLLRVP